MAFNTKYDGLEIAIIGMSGQFPESGDCREFWKNLENGRELLKTFTDEELRMSGVSETELRDEKYVKTVGVLSSKDSFDNAFFGYSEEEAALMDPQIRLMHEHCWKALEDAAYSSSIDKNRIGLFAGASVNDNWKIYANARSRDSILDPFYLNMITSQTFINTLVSYKLNLKGPSYYVDTACSTSLAAIHLACRSLLTRECSMALAGGAAVGTRMRKGYRYREGMIASKDGHCRAFDAEASGTASGEGVGVVVLKRLNEAIKDGDHIYAVIRSTVANNDGAQKVGYTAPSVQGQVECITAAHKLAGIDPRSISYIEAHGTATRLGDPVEIRALNEAFSVGGNDKFCAIGSVKTNIGHLDTAAGVAGLIKTALSLKNKKIPASLYFKRPNPEIDFEGGPFYVNTELKDWQRRGDFPLRAGVSSLGIGGTNVHVILEEAPEPEPGDEGCPYKLLMMSAKTESSLTRSLYGWKDFVEASPGIDLADMSYTLQTGRKHFPYRKSIVYKDREDLLLQLGESKIKGHIHKSSERRHSLVFMFPGQGAQYTNMGKGLYITEPVFRTEMDRGFSIIENLTGENFKDVLYPATGVNEKVNETRYTQPLIFLLEYSLARYLMNIGITPQYMIGHSIGEYVAACIDGVFSFEGALKLVVKRGELMNSISRGAMLSIPLSEEEAKIYLDEEISLAAANGPGQVVLSGNIASIDRLIARLEQSNVPYIKLHTSHAFHSEMMNPILESFRSAMEDVSFNRVNPSFVSNLTGRLIRSEEAASPEYWERHLRETVKFSDGIKTLLAQDKELIFIEAGPGHSLINLLKQQQDGKIEPLTVDLIRSFKEMEDDARRLVHGIGRLWTLGASVDWTVYYKGQKRNRLSLPAYSFEFVRYPTEVDPFKMDIFSGLADRGAGRELKDWIYFPSWRRAISFSSEEKPDNRGFLFFSFDGDFSSAVAAELAYDNNEVVEVFMGEGFEQISRNRFIISRDETDHYIRLLHTLKEDGFVITDVIYSWSMAGGTSASAHYFSMMKIMQALLRENDAREKRIAVLTNTLHKVTGAEQMFHEQSLLLGLMNVIMQEYPLSCCNIDLDIANHSKDMVARVAEEIFNIGRDRERIVALRGGHRWVQDYQKNTSQIQKGTGSLRHGGVYLITGGLGNLGFVLARHLIQQYGATVILMGRKRMGVAASGELTAKRFEELRNMSSSVRYFQGDVSVLEEFKRMVEEVERTEGPIRGIVHAAGVQNKSHFELVEDMTSDKVTAVFSPKVRGIENIYELFRDRQPDFVWITSSLAAVLGGLGYSAYSSANLYMDHFLSARSEECSRWKCIDLPGLAFTEEEIREGHSSLNPSEIIALFEWSISFKNSAIIAASKSDLPARIREAYTIRKAGPVTDDAVKPVANRRERPELAVGYMPATTETEMKLKAVFEDFFGIEGIGIEDAFFDLGGDSLKAMILLKRVKKEFNVNLSLQELLFHSDIKGISEKIDEIMWLKEDVEMKNEITI